MASIFKATAQNSKGQNISFVGAPVVRRVLLSNVSAANSALTLPARVKMLGAYVHNQTANAVTGGLKFGTTNGGVDIIAALAVAGVVDNVSADISLLKVSWAATQQIFIDAVTSWNSAVVDIVIEYQEFPVA